MVVIESAETTVTLKAFCVVCGGALLSAARMVKLNDPSAAGVPLSTPLDERLTPPGKEPATNDQVYGETPPVAVNVWE